MDVQTAMPVRMRLILKRARRHQEGRKSICLHGTSVVERKSSHAALTLRNCHQDLLLRLRSSIATHPLAHGSKAISRRVPKRKSDL